MGKKKKAKRHNGVNKSEFIRARPTAKPQEIIDAAKAEGIEITRDAVHKVRWQMKQHELLHPPKEEKPNKWRAKTNRAVVNGVSIEPSEANGNRGLHMLVQDVDEIEEMATAVVGAALGKALAKIVRSEVRAEVRRIMGAGVDA